MRLSLLLTALLLGAAPAAADESVVQHTDTANGFVLAYPASWKVVAGNIAASKFKVATPNPQGMETCSVVVAPNTVPADAQPSDLVAALTSADAYERSLQPYSPGARVIDKGSASVSGLPAFYSVTRSPCVTMGVTLDLTTIDVVMWTKGTAYKAQCTTETDRFAEYRTLFVAILSSFMVTNK